MSMPKMPLHYTLPESLADVPGDVVFAVISRGLPSDNRCNGDVLRRCQAVVALRHYRALQLQIDADGREMGSQWDPTISARIDRMGEWQSRLFPVIRDQADDVTRLEMLDLLDRKAPF